MCVCARARMRVYVRAYVCACVDREAGEEGKIGSAGYRENKIGIGTRTMGKN